jgi:hypothetical protein
VQRILIVTAAVLTGALGATAIPTAASAAPKQVPVCRTAKEKKRHKRANGTRCRIPVAKPAPPRTTPVAPPAPTPPVAAPAPVPVDPPSLTLDPPALTTTTTVSVTMSNVPPTAAGTHYRLSFVTGTIGSGCGFGYARVYSTTVVGAVPAQFGVVIAAPVNGRVDIYYPLPGVGFVVLLPIGDQPMPVLEMLGTRHPGAGWCLGPGQASLSVVPDDAPAGDAGTPVASAAFSVSYS